MVAPEAGVSDEILDEALDFRAMARPHAHRYASRTTPLLWSVRSTRPDPPPPLLGYEVVNSILRR